MLPAVKSQCTHDMRESICALTVLLVSALDRLSESDLRVLPWRSYLE